MGTKPNIRQFFVLKKIYLIAAGLAVVFLIVTNLILVKRVSDAETAVELRDSIIREAGSRSSSLEVKYLKSCFSGLLLNEDIKAFNAELVAADQRKYTLDQALGKGPVLILRYSELNCADCVVFALRKIAEIAEKYKEKIVVISLSVDPEAVWKETEVKESADNWLQLSDGLGMSGIAAHYGVHALPSFIYISPESTVLKAGQGYKFLSEDIRTFIKDK